MGSRVFARGFSKLGPAFDGDAASGEHHEQQAPPQSTHAGLLHGRSGGEPLAEAAKTVLARDFRDPATLDEVARRAGSSVFHLCRTFRRHTGSTLHGFRNQLRLAPAFP